MELEKCPFCGREPEIINESNYRGNNFFIKCGTGNKNGNDPGDISVCPGNNGWCNYRTEKDAVTAWNTRVSPWIKCEDELPENGEIVIFISELGAKFIGAYILNTWHQSNGIAINKHYHIIAWMPIPEFKEE